MNQIRAKKILNFIIKSSFCDVTGGVGRYGGPHKRTNYVRYFETKEFVMFCVKVKK